MLTAQRDNGERLRLSRQERSVIMRLSREPHKLVSRAQLLESLGDTVGELSERNVDYIINRLRKRLGDNSREPRFIATQYGEGYVWIADPQSAAPAFGFLVVGPVTGLAQAGDAAVETLGGLSRALRRCLGQKRGVVYRPDFDPAVERGQVDFGLAVSLHEEKGTLHLALVLRELASQKTIEAFRLTLPARRGFLRELDDFAVRLTDTIWTFIALPRDALSEPSAPPAYLRLHDAGALISGNIESWSENAQRLETARLRKPDDPTIAVLLAFNTYARMLQESEITEPLWRALEDEIETLVFEALPKIENDPSILLGLAKLLHFIDRGHRDLATKLAEQAFRQTTAFAAAFAIRGQFLATDGDLPGGIALYDQAIELAASGSQFHIYLLVNKAVALMAGNQRRAVEELTAELYLRDPRARLKLGLMFLSPGAKTVMPDLLPVLESVTVYQSNMLLSLLYNVSVRQFRSRSHQLHILRGSVAHLTRRLGNEAVPATLRRIFPELDRRPSAKSA
ncbi:winged helix-turn-helix domain-containing protein [Martelella alba]|uniref:Winged helix-turn-helix domain-containing protein n=1 Tax=Martelella alba TaxID=2590451 RepID=A0A506U106_9HYPH|nr:helix-turn-helix domain-containing protein [Martelella alba]TPW26289.1 winged helix-turn-helix domain-containing protein [Martelella alba]